MSRLHSKQAGHGPVLIVLHGLFGDLDNLRSAALHMERSMTVVRMDLPAHGLSPSLPSLSYRHMADAVLEEIANLGLREYHLLGHSLGGKVAMCMAGSNASTGLQSLTVVDIAPRAYPPHHQQILDALQAVDLQSASDRRDVDARLRNDIPDAGVRAFLLKSLYRADSDRLRWRFDLAQLARDYPLIMQAPEMQQRVEVPTLFIKGGNSDYLVASDENIINPLFSDASLKIISGTGHWPHAEKPAQFARICLEFMSHV